jgi:2-polyprenyl-3-methyl-5-hydroxy-6-metoxy-1,4-benzoquinol methylase
MSNEPNKSEYLFSSWLRQADRWIDLLSEPPHSINKLTSDKNFLAVLDQRMPNSVLDIGCSDGYIVDFFTKQGKYAVGVDTIEEFIDYAKESKKGQFLHCETTADLSNIKALHTQKFDLIVLNHGVFISDDLPSTLKYISELLTENGEIIIQTIHPVVLAEAKNTYKNSWQACYWELSEEASMLDAPYPMYIRTFSSWYKVFRTAELKITDICEPLLGDDKKPNSILFVCSK